MILYWPVGGAKYRINGMTVLRRISVYAAGHGLAEVAKLAAELG